MIYNNLIERCNQNWVSAMISLAQNSSEGRIEEFPDHTTIVRTGFPDQELNIVFMLKPSKFAEEIVRSVRESFVDTKTDYEVVVSPEASETSKPIVRELDLTLLRKEPGMLMDSLPTSHRRQSKGFEIHRVENLDELLTFFKSMNAGFGSTSDSLHSYIETNRQRWIKAGKLNTRGSSYYIGYHHGKPVATSVRYASDHIAGIFAVSTVEEFRRRGFGEAMVWRAVIDGKLEEDCNMSFLQASDMGRPLYERMGYRVLVEYDVWSQKKPGNLQVKPNL